MKTSQIILTIVVLIASVLCIVAINAFNKKRNFTVLFSDKYDLCFLVDDRYSLKLFSDYFEYSGGENKGVVRLLKEEFSKGLNNVDLNGFKAGYKKSKNLRTFEYKINDNYKLVDDFINAQKMPVNLVPYREECAKIKNNFKNHIEIFRGVKSE